MNHRYIQRGHISQRTNKPKGESAWHRGRTSEGANEPGGKQARGESAKGQKSHNSLESGPV